MTEEDSILIEERVVPGRWIAILILALSSSSVASMDWVVTLPNQGGSVDLLHQPAFAPYRRELQSAWYRKMQPSPDGKLLLIQAWSDADPIAIVYQDGKGIVWNRRGSGSNMAWLSNHELSIRETFSGANYERVANVQTGMVYDLRGCGLRIRDQLAKLIIRTPSVKPSRPSRGTDLLRQTPADRRQFLSP